MMKLRDLVAATMNGEDLAARQWVKDAKRQGIDVAATQEPEDLDGDALVVAAALVEMFAERKGTSAPEWTNRIGRASKPVFLSRRAHQSKVVRSMCEECSPEPLRRRNVFAISEQYLDVL